MGRRLIGSHELYLGCRGGWRLVGLTVRAVRTLWREVSNLSMFRSMDSLETGQAAIPGSWLSAVRTLDWRCGVRCLGIGAILLLSACSGVFSGSTDAPGGSPGYIQPLIPGNLPAPPAMAAAWAFSHPGPVSRLPAPQFEVNGEVRKELRLMLRHDGRSVREAMDRRREAYPLMVRIFEDEGVPRDLLNLALIESGFRREARSQAGAVGLWQFMGGTARQYGLRVGAKQDQRRDLILSTLAAARHLRDLYLMYQDWYLALAAYNAGPAAISRAVARSGSATFWQLSRAGRLNAQTARFVPKFIAASMVVKTLERYGADNLEENMNMHIAHSAIAGEGDRFALATEEVNEHRISYRPRVRCPSLG